MPYTPIKSVCYALRDCKTQVLASHGSNVILYTTLMAANNIVAAFRLDGIDYEPVPVLVSELA